MYVWSQAQRQNLTEYLFLELDDTISNALQLVESRCEDLEEPKDQKMRTNVFQC